ncbi:SCF E3 ubiquitin ligase complex F-box protein grrA [Leucoagaricus sp. SymC.cos]|nr:SCF E3 ubiquitin ligase complex F-box protein grrA [Leucoagaricus sp. SymC.cos]
MYTHKAPSNTSLSDDYDDDEPGKSTFFVGQDNQLVPLVPVPAQWSSKSPLVASPVKTSAYSPVSLVPAEILINIFKHVTVTRDLLSCILVSRTWCECAIEPLWHKPTFPKYGTMVKMGHVLGTPQQTFTYSRFIRRLNLMNLASSLKDDVLFHFFRCDKLERLTLVNCRGVSGELLEHFFSRFQHLIAIDLTNCAQTTNSALRGLAFAAKRLQGINLAGCTGVNDSGVLALAENCPLLRRVKFSNVSKMTDEAVIALATSCPLLLEIDLNGCSQITDVGVRSLWQYSTHMREMRLALCPDLTDNAFPAPPRIEQRALPDANPFASPSDHDSNRSLPPMVLNRSFEHIRMLDLTACSKITDDAIEGIISHAPKIRNLVLSKCALLTDRAIEMISKLGRSLHYLHLGHANKITDRSVRILARSCTRLRYIDFANCTLLTDMSVFELSALPKLRRVGLVRVNNLTDEAIYALAERHATLERIHLSYCDQITVMAVHFLLQKLHKLTHLSLTGIPAFRDPELQRGISQLRNHLTELFDSMNETNGTDDTEYEDDDYEIFNDDGTPEPDAEAEMDQTPVALNPPPVPPVTMTIQRGGRAGSNQPQAHEFVFNRDRSPRAATIPTSTIGAGRQGNNVPPSVNILGATSRLNAQIQDGMAIPITGPSRRGRQGADADQTIIDMLPIVETSSGSIGEQGGFQFAGYSSPDQHYAEMGYQQTYQQPMMRQQMDGATYTQYVAPGAPISTGSHPTAMDVDQWSMPDSAPSHSEPTAGPSGSGDTSQWNVGRTLRGVFHFGRNPQENLYQYNSTQPPAPPGGGYSRH